MREASLVGASHRRGGPDTTRRDQEARPAPDPVDRNFLAEAPNPLRVADIAYVPTAAGFLYRAVVLDAFSRRIVGWAMANHLRSELGLDALEMAVTQRRPRDASARTIVRLIVPVAPRTRTRRRSTLDDRSVVLSRSSRGFAVLPRRRRLRCPVQHWKRCSNAVGKGIRDHLDGQPGRSAKPGMRSPAGPPTGGLGARASTRGLPDLSPPADRSLRSLAPRTVSSHRAADAHRSRQALLI